MSKPYIHAVSSAKKYGGVAEDYMAIHTLMDQSKSVIADGRHRALTHNTWFIEVIIPLIFGETFGRESDDKIISSRDIAEQHVAEDFGGFIPAATDYLLAMSFEDWMNNGLGGPPSWAKVISSRKMRKID